jgi:hypothetical protein
MLSRKNPKNPSFGTVDTLANKTFHPVSRPKQHDNRPKQAVRHSRQLVASTPLTTENRRFRTPVFKMRVSALDYLPPMATNASELMMLSPNYTNGGKNIAAGITLESGFCDTT